jgi:hypothetical protein
LSELCEVCGEAEATHTCRLCGRKVCDKHFDSKTGLCAICSGALCEICHEKLAVTFCPSCGRLVCYDDSVQIDEVRRVCKECYAKGFRGPNVQLEAPYIGGAIKLARRTLHV